MRRVRIQAPWPGKEYGAMVSDLDGNRIPMVAKIEIVIEPPQEARAVLEVLATVVDVTAEATFTHRCPRCGMALVVSPPEASTT